MQLQRRFTTENHSQAFTSREITLGYRNNCDTDYESETCLVAKALNSGDLCAVHGSASVFLCDLGQVTWGGTHKGS